MFIQQLNYKLECYTVDDLNRGLTEKDIERYYSDLGFNTFKKYVAYIKGINVSKAYPILKNIVIPKELRELFNKYDSGYPDLLLEKNGKFKFVEIKLDKDSIRYNQIIFLTELSKIANVTVCYFNNLTILKREDFVKINTFTPAQKNILSKVELLSKIAKVKGNKPFWVVAELYKHYNKEILDKKILGIIGDKIGQPKDKVLWFIKTNLMVEKDPTKRLNRRKSKIIGDD